MSKLNKKLIRSTIWKWFQAQKCPLGLVMKVRCLVVSCDKLTTSTEQFSLRHEDLENVDANNLDHYYDQIVINI